MTTRLEGPLRGSGSTALSPEVSALLACARAVLDKAYLEECGSALALCTSTERLLESAAGHRMLGPLWKLVTSESSLSVDPGLKRRLSELQRASAVRTLRQAGHLVRTLDVLASAGIRAIPFKGLVWAQVLYGDITMRNSADLDLLVDYGSAPAAREALLANGLLDFNPFNQKMMHKHHGIQGQICLFSPEAQLFVDLHWKVNVATGRRSLEFEPVLSRSAEVEVLGRPLVCPSGTDMILMTCLAGTRDRWNTVGRLLDLAVEIRQMPVEGWGDLLNTASVYGFRRRLTVSVGHVCGLLRLEMPALIADQVAEDRVGRALVHSLSVNALAKRPPDGLRERLTLLFWNSATEDRYGDWLRQAFSRLFLPTSEDWGAVSLPRWLDWLCYPLRPGRLAVKWVGRLLRRFRNAQRNRAAA
jgi:hypothetical protein